MTKEQLIFHKSRRDELLKKFNGDSLLLILGNSSRTKSFDQNYQFKQDKNLYYLTGCAEPNCALLMSPGGIKTYDEEKKKIISSKEILFVQECDADKETWFGKRIGYKNVKKQFDIETGLVNNKLGDILNSIIKEYSKIYINFSSLIQTAGELKKILNPFLDNLHLYTPAVHFCDLSFILGKMRKVKTEYEIRLTKAAAELTAEAFKQAISRVKPGLYEYQVQSFLECFYRFYGAGDVAFEPIIASGNNACTLHYFENNSLLQKGDLLLIDSGAEYNYYNGDLTRTVPVSGKYSNAQKEIYELVLKANKETIKKIKQGIKLTYLRKFSESILARGLKKLGILKDAKQIRKYSLHNIGHHIGLDTHDAVAYNLTGDSDNDTLREGNIITIEPGLYFPYSAREVLRKYRGIGVRIEDDVLVTKRGCKVLSKGLPKEVSDIESLMKN